MVLADDLTNLAQFTASGKVWTNLPNDFTGFLADDCKNVGFTCIPDDVVRMETFIAGIEREVGNGRADIIMRRNDPRYPNIVVELKKSRSKTDIFNTMEKEARKALTQIKTKEYYLGMKGKTYLYGVCFQNKKAKVLFEEMDL